MFEETRSALKEWAAIEQLLAAGTFSILLRKGGISERKKGFEVEHREFWLFPTHFHQNPHELLEEHRWALESGRAAHPDGDRVRIEHYATVEEAYRVEELDRLHRLDGLHPLDSATVESRFHYRDRPYLHVLLLRVYSLPEPRILPNTLDYEGCVSWVELDDALATAGLTPVLDDSAFERIRLNLAERLGPEGSGIARI